MIDRRELMRLGAGAMMGGLAAPASAVAPPSQDVEQWGVLEW